MIDIDCKYLKKNDGCNNRDIKNIIGNYPRVCVLANLKEANCEFKRPHARKADKKGGKRK